MGTEAANKIINKEYDPESVYKHVVAVEKVSSAIKTVLERRMMEETEMHPLSTARDICLRLLKGSSAFMDVGLEGKDVRGCVAEVMLEEIMKVWLKEYHITGEVIGNVMLPVFPRTPDRKETSQIDILTVTDRMIMVCECKSYAGNKTTDGIEIKSDKSGTTIYPWKQNGGHIIAVKNNISNILPGIALPVIYNVVYMFADGKFVNWCDPPEEQDILLVNYGCLSKLNKLYDESQSVFTKSNINAVADYCRSKIPTVEEQADHILRINKII